MPNIMGGGGGGGLEKNKAHLLLLEMICHNEGGWHHWIPSRNLMYNWKFKFWDDTSSKQRKQRRKSGLHFW